MGIIYSHEPCEPCEIEPQEASDHLHMFDCVTEELEPVMIFFILIITENAAIHSLTHPQESFPAHSMSPRGSIFSPTQYSVLSKCSHAVFQYSEYYKLTCNLLECLF